MKHCLFLLACLVAAAPGAGAQTVLVAPSARISGAAIIIAVALNAQANRKKGRIILKRAEHAT